MSQAQISIGGWSYGVMELWCYGFQKSNRALFIKYYSTIYYIFLGILQE